MSFDHLHEEPYFVDGMKIIPLSTKHLKYILANNLTYKQVYRILDDAYQATESVSSGWYRNYIDQKLQN